MIKAAVMHFLGVPLDFCHRLVLAPASMTRLELDADSARLLSWNDTLTSRRLERSACCTNLC